MIRRRNHFWIILLMMVVTVISCGRETKETIQPPPELDDRMSDMPAQSGFVQLNERGTGPLATTDQAVALNDKLTAYKAADLERLGFSRGYARLWGKRQTKATLGSIIFEMRSVDGADRLLDLQRKAALGRGGGKKKSFDVPGIDGEVAVKASAKGGAAYEIFFVKENRFWRLLALFPQPPTDEKLANRFAADQYATA